jgi:hypothetical protein
LVTTFGKNIHLNRKVRVLNKASRGVASSAGISPDFFSKPIRRLKPIERPAEEATRGEDF